MVHSIEFIATPQDGPRVCKMVPQLVNSTLEAVTGYSGCLVLALDEEARIVTVMTFWKGDDRQRRCSENSRWVYKLIGPYLDHCLRERTYVAHQPAAAMGPQAGAESENRSSSPALTMRASAVCAA